MIATFTIAALAVLAFRRMRGRGWSRPRFARRPAEACSAWWRTRRPRRRWITLATIYNFDGSVRASSSTSLQPNRNLTLIAGTIAQGHCMVEVVKGGKRNLRVSLQVLDAGDAVLAAVPGQMTLR